MQYSQEHLKTMVYAEFGGQTECIMGNWKIENAFDFWLKKWQQRHSDRNKDTSAVEIFLTLICILLVAFQSQG